MKLLKYKDIPDNIERADPEKAKKLKRVEHTRRAILYEIEADGFTSRHKRYIQKSADEIDHAGIEIKIIKGWQRFNLYGKQIKARIIREWN